MTENLDSRLLPKYISMANAKRTSIIEVIYSQTGSDSIALQILPKLGEVHESSPSNVDQIVCNGRSHFDPPNLSG